MKATNEVPGRSEKVEQLHEQLQSSLQELVTSQDWQQALAVAARFHNYSFSNTQLIRAQALAKGFAPSRVAGYRLWQQLGRQVRRGENGIQILAPVIRKITPGNGEEEEKRVVGFRAVNVFDVSQTDGEPLPELTAELVQGDLPVQWERASELIMSSGFELRVADTDRLGAANGITDWQGRAVVVRASLPGAQRFKTAIHELAHIRLHEPTTEGRPNCRGIVEVEAESVAYMVCAALGIDSAGYSLPYVASWSGGDLTKVTATANRVIGCAHTVITQLEMERQLEPPTSPNRPTVGTGDLATEQPAADRQSPRRPDLEEVLTAAATFYRQQLAGPNASEAIKFLTSRGIGAEGIDQWQLGLALDASQSLTTALRRYGFNDDLLLEAGVSAMSRHGYLFDRMRNRVVFPIHSQHGAARGFAGRLLNGDGPKYLNTPETELYKKRSLLYGMHVARGPIEVAKSAVVVEGYTDAVAAHQNGITNVVATGGTALTPQHLETLGRIADEVTLAFDGDQAGIRAIESASNLDRIRHGVRIRVAKLPAGCDPADLVVDGRRQSLQRLIASAVPLEHHLIDQILEQHTLEEPEAMARAIRATRPILHSTRDIDDRSEATEYLARRVGRDVTFIATYLEETTSLPTRHRRRGTTRTLA